MVATGWVATSLTAPSIGRAQPPPPQGQRVERRAPPPPAPPEEPVPFGYRARLDYHERYGYAAPLGFYLGLTGHGTSVVAQSGGPEPLQGGGGFKLLAGLHLHPRVALELSWFESWHNPARVDTTFGTDVDYLVIDAFSLGLKINLLPIDVFVPYVTVGAGGYVLGSTYFGVDSTGGGFHLGAGVDWWVADFLTLNVGVTYRGTSMGPPNRDFEDTYFSLLSFEGGLGLHF
ncbi:MAG: outer membrane beta-barrel protein [Myxococcota bacterium]